MKINMSYDIVRKRIRLTIGQIPDFIDVKDEEHKKVFDNIQNVLKIFYISIRSKRLSKDEIEQYCVEYFTNQLSIYNSELSKESFDYLNNIQQAIINELEDEELYEAAYNLHKITTYDE